MNRLSINMSKWLLCTVCFLLVASAFTQPISAATMEEDFTDADVEELAKQLEFFFEEVIQYDENGNPIDVDIQTLENSDLPEEVLQEFIMLAASFEEASVIKEEEPMFSIQSKKSCPKNDLRCKLSNPKRDKADKCIGKEINKQWKGIFSATVISGIITAIADKHYTKAATQILKLGAKGSIIGISGTLGVIWWNCHKNL